MSQVLCIAGMHRSGTSLIASWLERCGLPIHDGEFHGPATGNPRGHFEDKQFVNLHMSAIKAQHPESAGWKTIAKNEIPLGQAGRDLACRLIRERTEKYPVWGWKDPRSVFFLEQWKELIPELKTLLIWRPYDLVVDSLLRRSESAVNKVFKVSESEAKSLWLAYNERVCEYKKAHPNDTLLVPIEFVNQNDRHVHQACRDRLDIALEYHPLSQLFEADLMSTRVLARNTCQSIASLEHRLTALSDLDGYN
jgi:hypothetical protein